MQLVLLLAAWCHNLRCCCHHWGLLFCFIVAGYKLCLVVFYMFHLKSMTMTAAGAILRRNSTHGGIQWLQVKHRMCFIRQCALHRNCCIRMAIKIVRDSTAFSVNPNYLLAHNLGWRPCYGRHKLKPSYNIVLFLCYGRPPSMMDAILATICDDGRAIR